MDSMTDGHFFEDLFIGQTATLSKTITEADIQMYATVSMDTNPIHLNEDMARRLRFGGRIAHGMLSASLISAVLGTHLPGPGGDLHPADGATVRAVVEIMDLNPLSKKATLKTTCMVKEQVVIDGQACVLVPSRA